MHFSVFRSSRNGCLLHLFIKFVGSPFPTTLGGSQQKKEIQLITRKMNNRLQEQQARWEPSEGLYKALAKAFLTSREEAIRLYGTTSFQRKRASKQPECHIIIFIRLTSQFVYLFNFYSCLYQSITVGDCGKGIVQPMVPFIMRYHRDLPFSYAI